MAPKYNTILVVCTANICRSPMGEALIREKLKEHQLDGFWQVESAGVLALVGSPPSEFSALEMQDRGLDIRNKRAQFVSEELMERSALILVMTHHHRDALRFQYRAHSARIRLFSELRGLEYDIDDPFGEPRPGYAECARDLQALVEIGEDRLLEWLEQANNSRPHEH